MEPNGAEGRDRLPAEPTVDRNSWAGRPGRFPVLDAGQLDLLRHYGVERSVAPGDVLFAEGDASYDMIVVLSGRADIVERLGQPGQNVLASYGPGQFLGEIGLLTGQRVFVGAVASAPGRVLAVPADQLRLIIAQEAGLSDLILGTFLLRHSILLSRGAGLTLVGSRFDPNTRRLLEVLARNRLVWTWLDLETAPEAEQLLRTMNVPMDDLPIIVVPGGPVLKKPDGRSLLTEIGISTGTGPDTPGVCDLLVIGAGPAGLAAAVYGASEGLATTLAEHIGLGGQAGTSSRIENYLGFPAGLSGDELAARATLQAQKFGVRIKLAAQASRLASQGSVHEVQFDDGETVPAKAIIIATGAQYNRPRLDRLADFEGVGVYYAATQAEARACGIGPVAIIGGGNSAGQAALFLSRECATVHMIIRADTIENSMSRYLIDRIQRNPRIDVRLATQVTALIGTGGLDAIRTRQRGGSTDSELSVRGLFVFIGARPGTAWLNGQLAQDDDGFLLTGRDIPEARLESPHHQPLFLETSRPGVFAVGDVRSGSVKRAAAAIGEGSVAVRLVFDRLQALGASDFLDNA
jgi:thioredoxin reductase (NADPH)